MFPPMKTDNVAVQLGGNCITKGLFNKGKIYFSCGLRDFLGLAGTFFFVKSNKMAGFRVGSKRITP
jgi:hypothetical protein